MRFGLAGAFITGSLALIAPLPGCGTDQGSATLPSIGRIQSGIQGGAVDSGDSFAVGVCVGQRGQCTYTCSGALIAPNLVVSARHCVQQVLDGNVETKVMTCGQTHFGAQLGNTNEFSITTSPDMTQGSVGYHAVAQIITPTPTAACGNDLSLLVLTGNVPASEATPVTPAVQYALTDHDHYSTTETAIGYGLTNPQDDQSAGQRHILQNIQLACIPGDKLIDCGNLSTVNLDAKEFISGDGTCEGDSGSSAYEQTSFTAGKPVSLGVLSRGGVSADGTQCLGSVYTRLDSWKDLIISTVKAAATKGGYAVPGWTVLPPVTPDAGPSTSVDGGPDTSVAEDAGPPPPDPGAFGASCSASSDCASNNCQSYGTDNFICTTSCVGTSATACPSGYACTNGNCLPGSGNTTQVVTTTTTGCSAAPGRSFRADPNKPVPWRGAGLGLGILGLGALRRRRRR